MPHKGTHIALAVIEVIIGVSAVFGGYALLTGTFGFAQFLPVAWLAGTPFTDYTVPGLVLLVIIGGGMLVAAATIFIQREWAVLLSAAMGVVMVGFEAVEVTIVDRNPQAVIPPTIVQQVLLAGLGATIFCLASWLWLQEHRVPRLPARHA
jgi:hypothetical protein